MTDVVLGEQGGEQAAAGVSPVVVGHDLRDVGDAQLVEAQATRATGSPSSITLNTIPKRPKGDDRALPCIPKTSSRATGCFHSP